MRSAEASPRWKPFEWAVTGLLAICSLVNDTTPYHQIDYDSLLSTNNPFSGRSIIRDVRRVSEKLYAEKKDASGTIGREARQELKRATKKDFGDNTTHWQQWIETHVKEIKPG